MESYIGGRSSVRRPAESWNPIEARLCYSNKMKSDDLSQAIRKGRWIGTNLGFIWSSWQR